MADPRSFPSSLAQVIEIPSGVKGTAATIDKMRELAVKDAQNPEFVWWARRIVSGVDSKDYLGEARALFEWVRKHVRYRLDPRGLEWVQTPYWTAFVDGAGDCFVKGTQVLRRGGHALVPIESLRVGDEIWGLNDWTRVERTWDRGIRKTWLIRLNNGSAMRLTPEHDVWRKTRSGLEVVKVSGLRAGDEVVCPDRTPTDTRAVRIDLRIAEIIQDNVELDCCDIATADHFVWLPEADWTVKNCDDMSSLIAAFSVALGHGAAFKTVAVDPERPDEFSHVYPLIGLRIGGKPYWVAADATQSGVSLGWEPPKDRIMQAKIWEVAPA